MLQQRGVPPSIEQVGDLLGSAQPTVPLLQVIHLIIPLEQKHPLLHAQPFVQGHEPEEDEELDDDDELLHRKNDGSQISQLGMQHVGVPLEQVSTKDNKQVGTVPFMQSS